MSRTTGGLLNQARDRRFNPSFEMLSRAWGNRRGKLWTAHELAAAEKMRDAGLSSEQIAKELNRTPASINGKLGHICVRGR